ncbi:zinc ribbon domain-containing protein [Haloimpatiens sp. FM7315]|uniref:zinc ribbon domain-containing protein n=1 Tax=Haloimpatiens sp. FM7315 TaxID=3298609 RepID=UPI00370ACED8
MKYCTNCGTKLEDKENTCPNCGKETKIEAPLKKDYIDSSNKSLKPLDTDISIPDSREVKSQIHINKKILILVALILVFSGVFYKVGTSLYNPEKIVTKFEKSINSDDTEGVISLLSCSDSNLPMNKENIKTLSNYFKENPSYFNKVMNTLRTQSQEIALSKDKVFKETFKGNDQKSILNFKSNGKKLLFFNDYTLNLNPDFINISVKCKDAKIYLNGKEICESTKNDFKKEIGPLMPGKYKLTANYKGKYANLNDLKEIDTEKDKNEENKVSVDLLENAKYITISCSSGYEDALLFINGKNTGINISKASEFGPVDKNSRLYGLKRSNDKTYKSEEVTVADSDTAYLDFSYAEDAYYNVQEQLSCLIDNYTYAFAEAINYNDFSLVEPYIYPGSTLYKGQSKLVPTLSEKGIIETCINSKVLDYTCNDDKTEGTIKETEEYSITEKEDTKNKIYNYIYYYKFNPNMGTYQLTDVKKN